MDPAARGRPLGGLLAGCGPAGPGRAGRGGRQGRGLAEAGGGGRRPRDADSPALTRAATLGAPPAPRSLLEGSAGAPGWAQRSRLPREQDPGGPPRSCSPRPGGRPHPGALDPGLCGRALGPRCHGHREERAAEPTGGGRLRPRARRPPVSPRPAGPVPRGSRCASLSGLGVRLSLTSSCAAQLHVTCGPRRAAAPGQPGKRPARRRLTGAEGSAGGRGADAAELSLCAASPPAARLCPGARCCQSQKRGRSSDAGARDRPTMRRGRGRGKK